MVTIPAKVKDRLVTTIKRFQPIVSKARDKDINESDTVTIIVDILSEMLGYDKYTEITSEFAIKKTFCDLALMLDNTPRILIEVKAAGIDLKEQHIKQAVDYGSNSGVDWVVLTNAYTWKVYKVIFGKPVTTDLIYEFNLPDINTRKDQELEFLYYLTKESIQKGSKAGLSDYVAQKQVLNRFVIGQMLMDESVISAIRKNLKKMASESKATNEEIAKILVEEVIKREVIDGDKAAEAKKAVHKAKAAAERAAKKQTKAVQEEE